jgi:cation diffusion facilitator CzcD-associated flavoprotein CzcO
MDSYEGQTVVIGAGAAGLAVAAQLRRRGIPAVVLERSGAVGASWRGRYDRLRLNSSRPFSKLPGARYPRGTGMFPSRDQVADYLDDYARRHELDIRFREHVERIDAADGGWTVTTGTEDIHASDVVVAAGYEHTFHVPKWPGRDGFEGRLIHSAEYTNADSFQGQDVLVVGPGSSGMEIAHDLAENGARRVRLGVRTPPNMILRDPLGPLFARLIVKLPTHRADRVMRAVSRKTVGDLSEFGLPEPEEGIASRLKRLDVAPAIVDREVVDAIRQRRIEIVAAVESIDGALVELVDGNRLAPDAIVAATGYTTGLVPIVGHLGLLDERGVPLVRAGEAAPGLRFVGYIHRPGVLGTFGAEARATARGIANTRRWSDAPRSVGHRRHARGLRRARQVRVRGGVPHGGGARPGVGGVRGTHRPSDRAGDAQWPA